VKEKVITDRGLTGDNGKALSRLPIVPKARFAAADGTLKRVEKQTSR
jgi:hypothetical protein